MFSRRILLLLTAFIFIFQGVFADKIDIDEELWSYIKRQSQIWYDDYVSWSGMYAPDGWELPIRRAFEKLVQSCGEQDFEVQWSVIDDYSFNAACFPGGQIIINIGALDFLDDVIRNEYTGKSGRIGEERMARLREQFLAPILAHELGHYLGRHMIKSMRSEWELSALQSDSIDISLLAFSREHEFEADYTGYILLESAGYDPDLMIDLLELMYEMDQDLLEDYPEYNMNVYFSTHPSAHERLSVFESNRQEYHRLASSLEFAFSDIQMGINLEKSAEAIENALDLYPENLYLLKAYAVCLHKQWLTTVSLKDQKLRGIIESPVFNDKMVFTDKDSRGVGKTIPGDRQLYQAAREIYEEVYEEALDYSFNSNYALLLCYSPDARDEELALELAAEASEYGSWYYYSPSSLNNLAVCLYMTGNTEDALELFEEMAYSFDEEYSEYACYEEDAYESYWLNDMKVMQRMNNALNNEFVLSDFTPILNFALCCSLSGNGDKAKAVAYEYLTRYETISSWASYLAEATGLEIPKSEEKINITIDGGIQLNDSIEKLLLNWGKADSIDSSYYSETEIWYYEDELVSFEIYDGRIVMITIMPGSQTMVNGRFGLGSSRADVENAIGRYSRISDNYYIYEGTQDLAVYYVLGTVEEICFFR